MTSFYLRIHDLFHDEALAYLRAAGVPTTAEPLAGAFHVFDAALPDRLVRRAHISNQVAAPRRAFAPS